MTVHYFFVRLGITGICTGGVKIPCCIKTCPFRYQGGHALQRNFIDCAQIDVQCYNGLYVCRQVLLLLYYSS